MFWRFRRWRRITLLLSSVFLIRFFWPSPSFNDLGDPSWSFPSRAASVGRVFIASNHWNSEHLLQQYWIPAVLDLIKILGRDNVYLSVTANGSFDNTLSILAELDKKLKEMGVQRRFVLGLETHADAVKKEPVGAGWIKTPRGRKELRRIPYLAKQRNEALEPLLDPTVANSTHKFDRILFLNDIVFTAQDAVQLLNTRFGRYAAACALDFLHPHRFYDTFALRDSEGREVASTRYPYFGRGLSRDMLLRGAAVPVKSCWNGMVAFDAEPFTPPHPLRFRGIDDALALHHLEGSECCLIHADNPESRRQGVWVNPNVRVGYRPSAYKSARIWPTFQEQFEGWLMRIGSNIVGLPWKKKQIRERVKKWEMQDASRNEPGEYCLVDEMHVLVENGWKHL